MTGQPNPGRGEPSENRYRSYEADDGSFVLYDDENDHAWIQSERMVELRR